MFKVIITKQTHLEVHFFFIIFLCALLPQPEFTLHMGYYFSAKNGLRTNLMSCYLEVCSLCRPYRGSLFGSHIVAFWHSCCGFSTKRMMKFNQRIPKALLPLGRTQGTSPDVCNNDRPQKNQSEASNLGGPVGLPNTRGKKESLTWKWSEIYLQLKQT